MMSTENFDVVKELLSHTEFESSTDATQREYWIERWKKLTVLEKKKLNRIRKQVPSEWIIEELDLYASSVLSGSAPGHSPSATIFSLSDTESVSWAPDGIVLIVNRVDHDGWRRVVRGQVKPLVKIDVDGDVCFKYDLGDSRVDIGSIDKVIAQLGREGRILCRNRAADALAAVFDGATTVAVKGHATYGVYSDGGKLSVCEEPVPVMDEQQDAWEQVKQYVAREVIRDEIKAYIDILSHWHGYEILPSIGVGLVTPFSPVLRAKGVMLPHVSNWAPEHDLGKSTTALIASEYMFGLEAISGSSINSDYRLAAYMNSICLPRVIDESEKLDRKLWPAIKESAERWRGTSRVTRELKMRSYFNRSSLLLTGNTFPVDAPSVLKRIEVARFDSSARLARRHASDELDRNLCSLQPIGFQLIRWGVEAFKTEKALLEMLTEITDDIRKERSSWVSPKRPQAAACMYLGLKILEIGCQKVGIDWQAPAIATFVAEVISPIESSTWELRQSPVDHFSSWFAMFRAEHTKVMTDSSGERCRIVVGEDEVFANDCVIVNGKTVPGFAVTSALLAKYNRQTEESNQIPSLKELAIQTADQMGIPYNQVLDSDMKHVAKRKIGLSRQRAAFIPTSMEDDSCKTLGNWEK